MYGRFLLAAISIASIFLSLVTLPITHTGVVILIAGGIVMHIIARAELGVWGVEPASGEEHMNAAQLLDFVNEDVIPDDAPVYVPAKNGIGLELATGFMSCTINGRRSVVICR
jgi:hypothetical protein